jgi:hypothetical protein
VRFQPRIKGGRASLGSAVVKRIRAAVVREAEKYDCSRSFVVATVLADHFGIEEQPDYAEKGDQ